MIAKTLDGKIAVLKRVADRGRQSFHKRQFSNFSDWYDHALVVSNPDEARHALYYVFQPLYDLVINGDLDKVRPKAVKALDDVMETGIEYLTGFYLENADVTIINKLAERVGPVLKDIRGYRYKDRNVDRNDIYPEDIGKFLHLYLEKISQDGKSKPDVIVGCACGSSEIAMALAGIIGAKLVFARKSKRRCDEHAIIVDEHEKQMAAVKKKKVLVVEDYVCTAGSLYEVVKKVREFEPKSVHGASVMSCYGGEVDEVKAVDSEHKFNTFKIK
jgi:adenine/guanine phosphoribosyltransferase-like PRPP-binding protein